MRQWEPQQERIVKLADISEVCLAATKLACPSRVSLSILYEGMVIALIYGPSKLQDLLLLFVLGNC